MTPLGIGDMTGSVLPPILSLFASRAIYTEASMADIINLRQARKTRSRAASDAKAAANRILHGRTKEEKQASRADKARLEKLLDDAKRDPS